MTSAVRAQSQALEIVQRDFAIAKLNGKFYGVELNQVELIRTGRSKQPLTLLDRRDTELGIRRLLEASAVVSDPKKVIADFWSNPSTPVYTRVAFDPEDSEENVLNLWCPSPIQPKAADWYRIYEFLHQIICNGDDSIFQYLYRFLAHALRHPSDKPGVVIVLLGGQGVGKGLFFKLLSRLWPTTSLMVSDVKQVVGGFNAALESKYVVLMDEAIFKGDKASTEHLKSMVTEEQIVVEEKYQPRRSVRSIHRFFAASNADHFSHVDRDDRRFLFLRVSSAKQGVFEYFERLVEAIEDMTVLGGFVDSLMRVNLSGFNVRQRPRTEEHAVQSFKSLSGFERFWFEVLLMCDLRGRDRPVADYNGFSPEPWERPRFVPTTLIVSLFTDFDAAAQRYGAVQQSEIHRQLERLCPSSQACRRHYGPSTGIGQQEQHRGFDLPDLETARAEFCEVLRVDVDWGTGAVTPVDKEARNESAQIIAEDHAWWDSDLLKCEAFDFGPSGGAPADETEGRDFLSICLLCHYF